MSFLHRLSTSLDVDCVARGDTEHSHWADFEVGSVLVRVSLFHPTVVSSVISFAAGYVMGAGPIVRVHLARASRVECDSESIFVLLNDEFTVSRFRSAGLAAVLIARGDTTHGSFR